MLVFWMLFMQWIDQKLLKLTLFPSSFRVLCVVWHSLCLENRELELANICGRRETIRLVCFDWTNGFNNGKLEIILVYRLVNERFFRQQFHLLSFHLLASSHCQQQNIVANPIPVKDTVKFVHLLWLCWLLLLFFIVFSFFFLQLLSNCLRFWLERLTQPLNWKTSHLHLRKFNRSNLPLFLLIVTFGFSISINFFSFTTIINHWIVRSAASLWPTGDKLLTYI